MRRGARLTCCALLLAQASCSLGGRQQRGGAAFQSGTTRWVVTPSAIASLSSGRDTRGVPEVILLGDPFGRSALYLKFPKAWREHGRARTAFLTLTPSSGATSDDATISVEVWRVKTDWQPEQLQSWHDKPELGPPYAHRDVTCAPARELRIDITELVRFAAENPERDFGLALLANGGSQRGSAFATGMTGDAAPRLEVYVY